MTTEREAFEVWAKPFAYSHCEMELLRSAWHDAWKVSRKQALEEAVTAINALIDGWGDLAEEHGMRLARNEIEEILK